MGSSSLSNTRLNPAISPATNRSLNTSVRETGQIYVPFVNWGLFVLVVVAVVFFGSSTKLAGAYGVAVTIDMTITTVMTFFVIRFAWKLPLPLCLLATGFFFLIDITFFASNMLKLVAGGWFPIVIGIGMFIDHSFYLIVYLLLMTF